MRLVLAAGLAAVLAVVAGPAARASAAEPDRIRVHVLGLRNDAGKVRCLLFSSEYGWPGDADKAAGLRDVRPRGREALCEFDNPGPGRFAVSYLHDENDNDRMDRGALGIPTEGYGFSNDARGFLAPPSFRAASFQHEAGAQDVRVHTSYP
jgi:uncharacterized protein (DUF2141 family)